MENLLVYGLLKRLSNDFLWCRGIAVHPKQGYLFYSDWADKAACIGRALLDGSNHSIIVPTNNNKGQPQVRPLLPL
jgi:hypothetical protein